MGPAQRVRLTRRGIGLAALGGTALLAGLLLGVRPLVQVGGLCALAVVAGAGWLVLEARGQHRGRLQLVRHVSPHPVTVGERAVVQVDVTASGGAHRLDRLQIAERAARELSGSTPLRARVQRSPGRLTLTYPVRPERRGRWAVGPLEVQRRDLFGVARWHGPLGSPTHIAVRPVITPLEVTNRAASTDTDRAALGARTPAADDASLRDYRIGDDLRRVHWRSSARRGELVVRQDERSGRRPASVVLDLAQDDAATEWSIGAAASIAVALLQAGHQVRLVGGDVPVLDHVRLGRDGGGTDALLDQTVDYVMPPNLGTRIAWTVAAVDAVAQQAAFGSELVFAVVGALEPDPLTAMARLGATSTCWAMVRVGRSGGAPTPDEVRTLEGLRHAGWTVCAVHPGDDVADAWDRLLQSDATAAVAR